MFCPSACFTWCTIEVTGYVVSSSNNSGRLSLKQYIILADMPLKASNGTLIVCLFGSSLYDTYLFCDQASLLLYVAYKSLGENFLGRVVVPSPQNSYEPSQEATLLRKTRSVQRLARSFGTLRQTHILLLYYKDIKSKAEISRELNNLSLIKPSVC